MLANQEGGDWLRRVGAPLDKAQIRNAAALLRDFRIGWKRKRADANAAPGSSTFPSASQVIATSSMIALSVIMFYVFLSSFVIFIPASLPKTSPRSTDVAPT